MTQIQELFVHPIKRDITTVVKMDDLRLREMKQELEEYVVTDAIEDLLVDFLERYVETRTGQTDHIGVWISGFFGSGKSHFAKILSYLLANRQVGKQTALDIFRLRILDSPRQREIERLLHQAINFIDTEIVAFQIKTEEDLMANVPMTPGAEKVGNHISTIMYRQWLKSQGYSITLWVARLERELTELGQYEAFRETVAQQEGKPWEEVRKHDMLVRDAAVKGLRTVLPERYTSAAKASKAIDDIQRGLQIGPSILAEELADWVEGRRQRGSEKTPHLVYIIDEMGQFIGDDNQKLLELQSIAEAFATKGLGKLWLVVTAQEALEKVVLDAGRRKNEFSKIRDRFNLRLALTSENIETVLEERILKKKESQRPSLDALYQRAEGNIGTVCTLQNTNRPLPEPDLPRFVADYPLPPYQVAILQEIFAEVRTSRDDDEKIEGTERSLIGVTQAVLKSPATGIAESSVGRIVALDEVYDQIESELPSIDRRTIDEVRLGDEPDFLKRLLKALYLIQKLEWVPRTAGNLARLIVREIDTPRVPFTALKKDVALGLERLEQAHYILERDGHHEFISGVKKDIEMKIAAEEVTVNHRRREIKKFLETVLDFGRLYYQRIKRFDIRVRGDDEVIHDRGDITLQVYTPIYVRATDLTREEIRDRSFGDERTVYWYPAPTDDLYRELTKLIQTDRVVSSRMSRRDKSPEEESILRQKQRDMDTAKAKIQTLLTQSLLEGAIIYDGEIEDLAGRTGKLSTIFRREVSQIIPHVYTRFDPAAVKVDEKSIERILTVDDAQLPDIELELSLFDDAYRLNRHAPVVNEVLEELRLRARAGDPRDGKTLTDFFEGVPYGWDPILVRIVLAALFRAGVISLKYEGRVYHDYKVRRARDLMIKARSFRKTEFLYDPSTGLTKIERQQAQKAIDRIFHRREPDTVNIMAAALEKELNALHAQNAEQRVLAKERELPVKPVLYKGHGAMEEIRDEERPDLRLKAFLKQQALIHELKDYQENLQAFIDQGRPAQYAQAQALVRAVKSAQQEIPTLNDKEVQTWLEEMAAIEEHREIVEKWAAFYQNMQHLLQRYQAAYEQQHQARYEAYAQVQAELAAMEIPADALNDRLCEGPVGWTLDGLTCTSCSTGLKTLYYQTRSASEDKMQIIDDYTPPPQPQPGKEGDEEPRKPELLVLRLDHVIKTHKIRTQNDLETAVQELRTAVQAALDEDKHVILG